MCLRWTLKSNRKHNILTDDRFVMALVKHLIVLYTLYAYQNLTADSFSHGSCYIPSSVLCVLYDENVLFRFTKKIYLSLKSSVRRSIVPWPRRRGKELQPVEWGCTLFMGKCFSQCGLLLVSCLLVVISTEQMENKSELFKVCPPNINIVISIAFVHKPATMLQMVWPWSAFSCKEFLFVRHYFNTKLQYLYTIYCKYTVIIDII